MCGMNVADFLRWVLSLIFTFKYQTPTWDKTYSCLPASMKVKVRSIRSFFVRNPSHLNYVIFDSKCYTDGFESIQTCGGPLSHTPTVTPTTTITTYTLFLPQFSLQISINQVSLQQQPNTHRKCQIIFQLSEQWDKPKILRLMLSEDVS